MVFDIKPILIDQLTKFYESIIWLIPIAISISIYFLVFRREIAYDLNLSYREQRKLAAKSLIAIITVTGSTLFYLYVKECYFLVSIILSSILTYFLYLAGILDYVYNMVGE